MPIETHATFVYRKFLPPWEQKIFSSMTAAAGRQLKQSVNVFHNF